MAGFDVAVVLGVACCGVAGGSRSTGAVGGTTCGATTGRGLGETTTNPPKLS
jgi:hypothetical protein